jgi:hypothetical protein
MTPLHVTNVDSEDSEMDEALELDSAEDKMPLQQNACRNMRRKMMVPMSTK